ERTTLQKYRSALATARNWLVGKTGRLVTRQGRKILFKCKSKNVKLQVMSSIGVIVEWGHQYARLYTVDGLFIREYSHDWTEAMLDEINFINIGRFQFMAFRKGSNPKLFFALNEDFGFSITGFISNDFFTIPPAPTSPVITET